MVLFCNFAFYKSHNMMDCFSYFTFACFQCSFDEIGSVLKIKELQNTKEELFKSLEMFYKVFYLGEEMEEETEE